MKDEAVVEDGKIGIKKIMRVNATFDHRFIDGLHASVLAKTVRGSSKIRSKSSTRCEHALTVGYRTSAVTMCMTRSAMLEVLREDYIRTARAKGLVEHIIINRHALKNALLPVVTLIGIEAAFLIGGLVVTEQVFNLNGIGRLFVQSVQNQDYTMTQALVMLVVAVFVLTNTVVDLAYAWLDPRIRYR